MTTRNLHAFFNPKWIAVVGTSDTPSTLSSIALHNLVVGQGNRVVSQKVDWAGA